MRRLISLNVPRKKIRVRPIDANVSPRFAQPATFARLPHQKDLTDIDVAFVGVPFDDATSYRPGSRLGPSAVRELSRGLRTYNASLRVAPFEVVNVVDYGDVDVVPGYVQDTFERVTDVLHKVHSAGVTPLVCGGDHSISLPSLRAAHRVHGPLYVLDFDAHFDFSDSFWGKKYTHSTWVRRALEEGLISNIVELGIRGSCYSADDFRWAEENGIEVYTMDMIEEKGYRTILKDILGGVPQGSPIYVSIDIDAVDPAYAPGTGAPEIGGFTGNQLLGCIRMLRGYKLVSLDVTEVSPLYDNPTGLTSILAANVFYEAISVLALNKSDKQG
ncbi:agmatinase [Candidatus Marsarchaeota G2 archaeon OSP_D]|uniref:Agmatinase n=2 Tax=Candidatus Marsarchaeota group 2 TaxID=2203771 RepID=A0A2R6CDX2_9ARCH|nr:MAG: agmatinase [Candidatus Marsarchaeota G2 archaeon OSP_D]PSO09089.1 MAG: agmatinase [Candidatus Marsarchaeota G2 archaeon BE_D]